MITLHGAPTLTTARLTLRLPQMSDFEAWCDCMTSDRSRFIGGPVDRGGAWRSFCHLTGHWVHRGFGMFVFADTATGRPLGMTGPWFPEGWPEQEIGWTVWDAAAEGKGYAMEAATAARAYAFGTLGWTTAISLIAFGNDRSEALAQRMGCVRDGDFTHSMFGAMGIWRHPAAGAMQ
jgi:RimJ/RimL family protein N-acetyltransferase